MHKPIQRVKLTKAIAHYTKIRDRILRSDIFAQVNLISAARTLQNLRIGLRRRQQGAREAAWKLAKSVLKWKEHESVKTTPQMTRFQDAKVCNNLGTDEIDDHRIQSDYKCTIGLQNAEGKNSTLGIASAWWNRARHQSSTQRTWTSTREVMHEWSHVRIVPLSGSCRHDLHTISWLKCDLSASSHVHTWSERFSSILGSPFHPTSSSPHSCSISCTSSTTLRAAVTLRTSPERRWTLLTNPTSSQVMSPRTATSCRLMSSTSQSPWPTHSSPSYGSSRMWITMTPRSRRRFTTHNEYTSITPSEKTCLSVCRRRPCPSERGDMLKREQGLFYGVSSGAKRWKRTE